MGGGGEGEERWTTSGTDVRYDSRHVELEQIAMQQANGRKITFDPSQGVAKFPYVFVPSQSFIFELKFTQPQLVSDVTVTVGGSWGKPTWHRMGKRMSR
ncbi:hypothetical protein N6H14_09175 [Paenibacillus sp. CC-CFT747]|nr:hypothetical protein N6H14_09175 [Paenibacillus sp. CC-CFT747]